MANESQGTTDTNGNAGAGAAGDAAAAATSGGGDGTAAASGAGAVAGDASAAASAAAKTSVQQGDAAKPTGFNETWRADYVAGKKDLSEEDRGKLLKRLERYPSLTAALDGGIAAQNKISEIGLKKPLSAKATPEEIAEYRKENGIPDKPEGYLENLPQGLVIGDADKPLFADFNKGLHALNADPKIAQFAIKWYNDLQEKNVTAQLEADETMKATTEDALRSEWGNDYRTNINAITGLLDGAPPEVSEVLLNARAGDGKAIMNDPGVVRWLVNLAREVNPVHSIVPGSNGATGSATVEEEIATHEKFMREDRPAYNRDVPRQERLRSLYEAREKLKGRAA